jgi:hypothetical protein
VRTKAQLARTEDVEWLKQREALDSSRVEAADRAEAAAIVMIASVADRVIAIVIAIVAGRSTSRARST